MRPFFVVPFSSDSNEKARKCVSGPVLDFISEGLEQVHRHGSREAAIEAMLEGAGEDDDERSEKTEEAKEEVQWKGDFSSVLNEVLSKPAPARPTRPVAKQRYANHGTIRLDKTGMMQQ